jgi:hypothetical protein
MALAPNPPICLTDLRTEFGDANGGNVCLTEYYAGGANVAAGTSGTNGAVPSSGTVCLTDFLGTSNIVMGTFPAFSQGYTLNQFPSGSTSSTAFSGYQTHFSQQTGIQCGAFAVVGFRHTPSNGYVSIEFYSGTNQSAATVYYNKLTYSGLANATWEVKYEYPNRSTDMDTYERYASETTYDEAKIPSTSGGGNRSEGTYYQLSAGGTGNNYFMQFPYIATANFRNSPLSDNAQARIGDGVNFSSTNDVQFTLRATLSGTSYTAASTTFNIELIAQRGAFLP